MLEMTRERQEELLAKAEERLTKLGAEFRSEMLILQEDEIERLREEIETLKRAQVGPADGDLVGELLEAQAQSAIIIELPENVREINVKELHIALK